MWILPIRLIKYVILPVFREKRMGVIEKDDNVSSRFVSHFHPSWQFETQNIYSLKNLKSRSEKLNAVLGFFSGLAFLETFAEGIIDPEGFVVEDNGLPKLMIQRFCAGESDEGCSAKDMLQSILFSGKTSNRGKIPKGLENTVRWFRSDFLETGLSLRTLLARFLDAAADDGFNPAFPPLWSSGITWEPPQKPAASDLLSFSPSNLFYHSAMKNWGAANSMRFISLDTNLPYPYSSLEPLVRNLLPEDKREESPGWLQEFVPLGKDKISSELRKLFSENDGLILWGQNTDDESRKVIDEAVKGGHPPLVICFDRHEQRPGIIKDAKLLWLPEEGEAWYKASAANLGCETPEDLADILSSEDSLSFSSFRPLFPGGQSRSKSKHADGRPKDLPFKIWRSAFETKNAADSTRLKARALIEEGQISLGLSFLDGLSADERKRADVQFLRVLAFSRLGDYSGVLKEAGKIRSEFSSEDEWVLELLKAQALWISGKMADGRELLLRLLKEETSPRNRFRLLCQLSMHYLNSNDAFLAQEFLNEAKELSLHFEAGPMEHFLLNHNSGTIERVRDRLENSLGSFTKALKHAEEGGFYYFQVWCLVEIGNILRLSGKFDEAMTCFCSAVSGANALKLDFLADTARFDAIIAEIEAGKLLKAEDEIRKLMETRKTKISPLEKAVEYYWLARILHIRGQLIPALEEVEKGITVLSGSGSCETRIALLILKGNILYSLNDYKALSYVLGKLSEDEDLFKDEPDLAMEYSALLLLSKTLKVNKISPAGLAAFEKLAPQASPVAAASYLLSKARVSGKEEAPEYARKAFELGCGLNSVQIKSDALAILQEAGRLPQLSETELARLEKYLKENKVSGPAAALLSIFEKKKSCGVKGMPNELDFLSRAKESLFTETSAELLKLTKADALIIACPPNPLLVMGTCGEGVQKEAVGLAGIDGSHAFNGNFIVGCQGWNGSWGALIFGHPPDEETLSLFNLWLSLPRPEAKIMEEENRDVPSGQIDGLLIGASPAMKILKKQIIESAPFNFPILLTGEPGTGKEVCAKALHFMSSRSRKNWTAFNCANLTPTLATSQLFGHKKGSFTGADSDKEGLVEAAKDSTLFLDEIGELPLETQAQFLRFLQDGSYQPLGSNMTRNSNARVVAATNRKLEDEINKGRFREDLYYRLKVISIEVPPLRERKEDIAFLFDHFLEQESEKEKIKKPVVEKSVYLKLMSNNWSGNVRELQNFVRRLIVASHKKGVIEESMVEFEKSRGAASAFLPLKKKLESAEKDMVQELLKRHDFNLASASKEAGLTRQALYQRAKKLGLLKTK
jgi:DNA-binding NtrC family response regulator/tetratricopeptide (TPR) repeat protein